MKILIVVDMQKDFVDGTLRNEDAIKIVPNVVNKVRDAYERDDTILIFTKDTHDVHYMDTEEGRNLPVPHCIEGTEGWEIINELREYTHRSDCEEASGHTERGNITVLLKKTFGCGELGKVVNDIVSEAKADNNDITEIELIGLCTDICVISNAMLVKAFEPGIPIYVDSSCCAGVTPDTHENALKAMKQCHIHIR